MVYLGLGTNIGNKLENLRTAIKLLTALPLKLQAVSGVYKTEPVGLKTQPDFYNICISVETLLSPDELLDKIKGIEREMGRIKADKWGPRIIDIDILFYSNIIISSEKLIIPHHEIKERRFVLEPLSEIAGEIIHPALNISVKELLKTGNFNEKVERIGELW
jgi:2-amino-4-hydroxy-6-hydroxymethyldihydropteridine diphosphokinase